MSLNVALLNSISALHTYAQAINVTAQNVSNVNTEGYSRKIIHQEAVNLAGQGAGVRITDITRTVNTFMIKDLRSINANLGESEVKAQYYQRIQDLFGSLSSNSSTGAKLGELAASFRALSETPENVSLRSETIERAKELARKINDLAKKIETFRLEVDQDIDSSVDEINSNLALVQKLNIEITQNENLNFGTAELRDQRDLALNKIAEQIGITTYERSSGQVVVLTETGYPLIDGSVREMSHDSASAFTPEITWASGSVNGITVSGIDFTADLSTGRLSGLIEMRDTIFPDLHSQFQELATLLHDEINALHNQGTGFPGFATTTGTRNVATGDTPSWSGDFRVTAVDTSGVVVETSDFTLGGYATIGDLVTAIDAMTNVTASITNGKVVIAATGSSRIAFNEMTSAVKLGDRTVGASEFLGLNDFFTSGKDYDDYASAYQANTTTALGLSGTLTFQGVFGTTTVDYTSGNAIDDLVTSINANGTLSGAGISASAVTDGSGYRLRIYDSGGDNFFVTDDSTLISSLNIKVRDTNITASFAVNSVIVADPSRVSSGTLSSSGSLTVGDTALTSGDRTAIQAIANKFEDDVTFNPVGGLPEAKVSFAGFASEILSLSSAQTVSAQTSIETNIFLKQNVVQRIGEIGGVNIDEEMANLIMLENAYSAAARVIQVTQELFKMLERIV